MHFRLVKSSLGFFVYSSICSSLTTSILHSAAKNHKETGKDFVRSSYSDNDMFNLGTHTDGKYLSGELAVLKSDLKHDMTYKLVVGSQLTTGSIWFVADVYAGKEYKYTNHNYGDLKMMLTTDYKSHLAKNGLVKHGFKVEGFRQLEDYLNPEPGLVGAPEKLYTFLTLSKDVEVGDYVVLFAYGRTFSDDLPAKFKEFRVKVL